jgi:hypothetical protein
MLYRYLRPLPVLATPIGSVPLPLTMDRGALSTIWKDVPTPIAMRSADGTKVVFGSTVSGAPPKSYIQGYDFTNAMGTVFSTAGNGVGILMDTPGVTNSTGFQPTIRNIGISPDAHYAIGIASTNGKIGTGSIAEYTSIQYFKLTSGQYTLVFQRPSTKNKDRNQLLNFYDATSYTQNLEFTDGTTNEALQNLLLSDTASPTVVNQFTTALFIKVLTSFTVGGDVVVVYTTLQSGPQNTAILYDVYRPAAGSVFTAIVQGVQFPGYDNTVCAALPQFEAMPGNKVAMSLTCTTISLNPSLFLYQYDGAGGFTALPIDVPLSGPAQGSTFNNYNQNTVQMSYGVGASKNILAINNASGQFLYRYTGTGLQKVPHAQFLPNPAVVTYICADYLGRLFVYCNNQFGGSTATGQLFDLGV